MEKKYDIIDFDLGVKLTGAGFPVYKGKGARLQRMLHPTHPARLAFGERGVLFFIISGVKKCLGTKNRFCTVQSAFLYDIKNKSGLSRLRIQFIIVVYAPSLIASIAMPFLLFSPN